MQIIDLDTGDLIDVDQGIDPLTPELQTDQEPMGGIIDMDTGLLIAEQPTKASEQQIPIAEGITQIHPTQENQPEQESGPGIFASA